MNLAKFDFRQLALGQATIVIWELDLFDIAQPRRRSNRKV